MRRRYTKNVKGADAVVWGIPFDAAVSNRPGARFGPQAIRRASAIFDNDPQYPFHRDLFETMAVVDYGDCLLDNGNHQKTPATIEREAAKLLKSGAFLLSLGGDHFVTWPLLKAHAAIHGPLALVQFDAHQDTWDDDGKRIDHGSFVARAVRDGIIDPDRSIQIGIRTHAPDDCGIKILYGHEVEEMRAADIADAIVDRTGGKQDLCHLRHRLPRPGLCAGHRHAGRRRSVLGQDPVGAAAARRRSTSSAPTWSRLRRPTTMPISRRSPARPSRCSISACSPSERRGRTSMNSNGAHEVNHASGI